MFRLFRRFRQRLLFDKKFDKYLLYATGEVFILIFGIVIALQVNNWNEDRKLGDLELVILRAIKSDLEKDLLVCRGDILVHQMQVNSSNIILDHMSKDLPFNDSLNFHFLNTCNLTATTYNTASYETLKSLGVGLVSNTELRNELIAMYDGNHNFLTTVRKILPDLVDAAHKTLFPIHFEQGDHYKLTLGENAEPILETEEELGKMIPLEYENLKKDIEYLYFLKTQRNRNDIYISCLEWLEEQLIELISNIEKEIKKLES